MARCYIGLGANLGDPQASLAHAFEALATLPDTQLIARSSLYRSAPMDCAAMPNGQTQPDYVNAVAAIETDLSPHALLTALLSIEHAQGRQRSVRNAARSLDLDLLLYGQLSQHDATLTLPHPRLCQRAFVLLPLAEIAPDCLIPGAGCVQDHLSAVATQSIQKLER